MTKTLDHITAAVNLVRQYGESEASRYWCSMDKDAQTAFDAFLVHHNDELAQWPGTAENRFRTRVTRMATLAGPLNKG